ncbi:MAG: hypothetical protein ACPGWS_00580 [Solirubrobacterales bacterium]
MSNSNWACKCVKRDGTGNLVAVKVHAPEVSACRICGYCRSDWLRYSRPKWFKSRWYAVWHEYQLIADKPFKTRRRLLESNGFDARTPIRQLPFEPLSGAALSKRFDALGHYSFF